MSLYNLILRSQCKRLTDMYRVMACYSDEIGMP
jgi:hypothetical protein